jgi:hypothetical protein
MPKCECCGESKTDVSTRVGLRAIDLTGQRTIDCFSGELCDACTHRSKEFGTREQQWLLEQIKGNFASASHK